MKNKTCNSYNVILQLWIFDRNLLKKIYRKNLTFSVKFFYITLDSYKEQKYQRIYISQINFS